MRCLTPMRRWGQKAVFVLGDSQAATMTAAFEAAVAGRMSVNWVSRQACPLHADAELTLCRLNTIDVARRYRDRVNWALRTNVQAGDVVVVCALADYHFSDLTLAYYDQALVTMLAARGATLLLLGSIPILAREPALCRPGNWNWNAAKACETEYEPARRLYHGSDVRHAWARAEAFASSRPGVQYLQLFDYFCAPHVGACGAVVPGTSVPAYDNQVHLSRSGSMYLGPLICAAMTRWGLL